MEWGMPWPGAEVAAEAEEQGMTAFCAGEFADHDAYLTAHEMATTTAKAQVGTAIAYAFARSPFLHAAALRQLHRAAPGRVFAGFGSGTPRMNTSWFGVDSSRPLARMAELLQALRAYLQAENGERVQFVGEFYNLDARIAAPVLGRLDIPLLVGAFNKGMARVAGQHADGIVGHGLFTDRWWTEVVRPALGGSDGREHGWVITAINDDDPARATLDARRMVAFYLTVKTYDPYVAHHGWTEQVAAIRSAFAVGDTARMAASVTDAMLDAIAVHGSAEQARQMLRARAALPRDIAFLSPPSFLVSQRRLRAYARASLGLVGAR
jgi:5,10-methylenetetrahydromethanopterin reductase